MGKAPDGVVEQIKGAVCIAEGREQSASLQCCLFGIKHLSGGVLQPLQDVLDTAHVVPPAALGSIAHAFGLPVGLTGV